MKKTKLTKVAVLAVALMTVVSIAFAAVTKQPTKKPDDTFDAILALNTIDVQWTLSDPFVEFCAPSFQAGDDPFIVPATYRGIRLKSAGGEIRGDFDGETASAFTSFKDDGTDLFTADVAGVPITCTAAGAGGCEFSLGPGAVPFKLFAVTMSNGGGSPDVEVCITLDIGRD